MDESPAIAAADHTWTRPRRARQRPRLVVNLTSLIDVTFLLLVFFMVATTMSAGEQAYRMDLPERSRALHAGDPFTLDQEPLRIVVSSGARSLEGEFDDYQLQIDG